MAVMRTERKKEIGGLVYFVLAQEAGRLKIGTSTGLTFEKRFASLVAASPLPLVLIGAIRGGVAVERWCHYHCVEHRSHFEWFHWTPSVEAFARLVLAHGEFAAEQMCGKYYRRDRAGHTHYGYVPVLPQRRSGVASYLAWAKDNAVVPIGA